MKKAFIILFIVNMIISACSSSSIATPSLNAPTSTETSSSPTNIPLTPTKTPLPPTPTLVAESAFIKGVTLDGAGLDSVYSHQVIDQYIISSGMNYVALSPTCFSEDRNDTIIVCPTDGEGFGIVSGTTDQELVNIIKYLHSVGLRVILKPHALVKDDFVHQQTHPLGSDWSEAKWSQWFDSYILFITHYAQIAEEQQVDMFAVGNEQNDTTHREEDWRHIIAAVRDVYHGPITYAANAFYFEASRVTFWDALDYIGTNAYSFGQIDKPNPTVDEMQQHWTPYLKTLEEMSIKYDKQVLITEIGARAIQDYLRGRLDDSESGPYDGLAQADFYKAFFEALKDKPWIKGIILWGMENFPLQGGPQDLGYTFVAKPAEAVVREYFGGATITPPPELNYVEESSGSMWIYRDSLENSWYPWEEPDATTLPDFKYPNGRNSAFSIHVSLTGSTGLWLNYGVPYIDLSKYKWLEFYIMVGKQEPESLLAKFEDWENGVNLGSRLALVNDPEYIEGGKYLPGTWQRVKIPIIDFGYTDQKPEGFAIDILGCRWPCAINPNTDDIYIDDMRLVAGK